MIKIFFCLLLAWQSSFAFNYDDIASNFSEKDEKLVLKRLDIESDFIDDKRYYDLKNDLKKIDIINFQKSIKNNPKIFFTLKDMIEKSKVPDLFLYMAMIESKFLISAKSNKNAAGLWQIMPQTAKLLKLKVDKNVDERLDPIKSTKAAISYLSYLHERFKKWYLAALAYNCGETKLSKAIKKAEVDNIFVLLDSDKKLLPKETKDYIRRLIIAALIANSQPIEEFIASYKKTDILKTIKIKKDQSIETLASIYNIPLKEFKKYNAHILDGIVEADSNIYIPSNNKVANSSYKKYLVKKDTTLFNISKSLHISMKRLKKLNKIDHLFIKANSSIKIPFSTKIPKKEIVFKKLLSNNTKDRDDLFKYVIQKGDTLFTLSLKFNNKISTIKKLNPKIGYDLKAGKTILLKR